MIKKSIYLLTLLFLTGCEPSQEISIISAYDKKYDEFVGKRVIFQYSFDAPKDLRRMGEIGGVNYRTDIGEDFYWFAGEDKENLTFIYWDNIMFREREIPNKEVRTWIGSIRDHPEQLPMPKVYGYGGSYKDLIGKRIIIKYKKTGTGKREIPIFGDDHPEDGPQFYWLSYWNSIKGEFVVILKSYDEFIERIIDETVIWEIRNHPEQIPIPKFKSKYR